MALTIKSRRSTYHAEENMHVHARRKKAIRRTVITVVVLILLFIVGGLIYTWYMGKYHPVATQTVTSTKKQVQTKPAVDDQARVGVSSQVFTSDIKQGENVSLTVKTNPLAACSIRVEYNKQPSTDTGLVPKKADEYGIVMWTWTVESSQPVGRWPVDITCANAKNSGYLQLFLNVKQ